MKLITFDELYHVGELEQIDFTNKNHSLEGPCVSVSEHPDAWRRICKLGNAPLWTFTKNKGQFIDAHACSDQFREEVLAWGLAAGFVSAHQGIKTEMDSDEGTFFGLSLSLEEAIETWGDATDSITDCAEASDEGIRHLPTVIYVPTEDAQALIGRKIQLMEVEGLLLILYADKMLDIDGVFWNDTLDVHSYSAPRAGILPRKVRSWNLVKST